MLLWMLFILTLKLEVGKCDSFYTKLGKQKGRDLRRAPNQQLRQTSSAAVRLATVLCCRTVALPWSFSSEDRGQGPSYLLTFLHHTARLQPEDWDPWDGTFPRCRAHRARFAEAWRALVTRLGSFPRAVWLLVYLSGCLCSFTSTHPWHIPFRLSGGCVLSTIITHLYKKVQ